MVSIRGRVGRAAADGVRGLGSAVRIHESRGTGDALPLPGPLHGVTVSGGRARPVGLASAGLGGDDGPVDEVGSERGREGDGQGDRFADLAVEGEDRDTVVHVGGVVMGGVLRRGGGPRFGSRSGHLQAPCFERVER